MDLVVKPSGEVTTLYSELFDLAALGLQRIERASHVEADDQGRWWAEIINGPKLGPFDRRSQALGAEVAWLLEHRMGVGLVGSLE
jgi:hypothetical protein